MREHPILFSGAMVTAILAGTKTQTRRLVKGVPDGVTEVVPSRLVHRGELFDFRRHLDNPAAIRCPHGPPGARLWVREAHWYRAAEPLVVVGDVMRFHPDSLAGDWVYPAGMSVTKALLPPAEMRAAGWTWRPSIFLPRWASRLTLEVRGVRVERLHAITEADAKAEGVECASDLAWRGDYADAVARGHRAAFERLWDVINGKRAPWASNPWVWCVAFRRVTP